MAAKKKAAVSEARAKAETALKNAKSDQEKTVAAAALKGIKFKEGAAVRVSKLLSALENVQKLANRKAYAWEPAHAEKIMKAVDDEVSKLRGLLTTTNGGAAAGSKFTL